ncbi:guanylate kinase [Bacillus luti]|nr:hypothetical protein [Bacillus cereus]HDR8330597.1 hypothetical protein [Bacillus cereus]HDR8336337.1 hypothetical protein [Bacillus cereus]
MKFKDKKIDLWSTMSKCFNFSAGPNKKYPLFVILGPSGSGKTTVMREIGLPELVSFTTREMRKGEINGVDYHFLTKEDVEIRKENDLLAEWNEYANHTYGITKEELSNRVSEGPSYWIAEIHGFRKMKEIYPNTIGIYIYTNQEQTLHQLKQRGETKETIEIRMKENEEVSTWMDECDYIVYNHHNHLNNTVELIKHIITAKS